VYIVLQIILIFTVKNSRYLRTLFDCNWITNNAYSTNKLKINANYHSYCKSGCHARWCLGFAHAQRRNNEHCTFPYCNFGPRYLDYGFRYSRQNFCGCLRVNLWVLVEISAEMNSLMSIFYSVTLCFAICAMCRGMCGFRDILANLYVNDALWRGT